MENNKKAKIETIQLLRAIGCIMVVLCHTAATDFGQTGVDFFLVISGYVIVYSTEKKGIDRFWKKRLLRIIPLYYGLTIFTSALILIAPSLFNSYEVSIEYFIKSLVFFPYYHNGVAGPIMALGWTLNYEMFFYLIFWICSKISFRNRGLFTSVILIGFVILGKMVDLPLALSYWSKPVILEFVYGVVIYYIIKKVMKNVVPNERISSKKMTVLTYVFIFAAFFVMEGLIHIENLSRSFGVGIVASVVLCWCLIFDDYIYIPGWVKTIGNESYELYLLHIFVVRGLEVVLLRFCGINIFVSIFTVFATAIIVHLILDIVNKGIR